MNILVTGGLGFIGSHLVDQLVKKKHKVFIVDDLSTGQKKNKNKLATYYIYDIVKCIDNQKKIKNILKKNKIEDIFHLAADASVNSSLEKPNSILTTNFNASVAIIEACKKTFVKKFIFASTSAVYGEPEYLPVDEKHQCKPKSLYGLSKLMFENYSNFFTENCNEFSVINFRLPNVYGPRQRADLEGGVIAIFFQRMINNNSINIFGDGNQTRDWVHVNDIAAAFIKAIKIQQKKNEIIQLGSNKANTVKKLFLLLKDKLHYEKKPKYCNKREGDIEFMMMSNKKASKILKWSPTVDLKKGLENLINDC